MALLNHRVVFCDLSPARRLVPFEGTSCPLATFLRAAFRLAFRLCRRGPGTALCAAAAVNPDSAQPREIVLGPLCWRNSTHSECPRSVAQSTKRRTKSHSHS